MRTFFPMQRITKVVTNFCNSSHWKIFLMLVTQRSSLRGRHNALSLSLFITTPPLPKKTVQVTLTDNNVDQ